MVETVCLDENEHGVTMLRGVREMKDDNDLCDFIIKVGDDEYPAHKLILSSGSPYFKAMLKHDTTESRDGKVEMKEVDSECVKSCIDFLYSGKFVIPDGKIGQLLHVAIMLQLDKVKDALTDNLSKKLNTVNFYETRDIAILYGLETVKKICKVYYEENFMEISSQPDFKNAKKSHLVSIMKSKKLTLTEEEKLTAALRWVGDDPKKIKDLFQLMKLIRMKDVPLRYFSCLLEENPIIRSNLNLYKLISAPLVKKAERDRDMMIIFDCDANCLQSYDPASDTVARFHDEKFNHLGNFSVVPMDSFIYILCEDKSVHRLNFQDKTTKWDRMRDIKAEHGECPPVVSFSGSLFVIGSDIEASKSVEMFVPAVNQWFERKEKPKPVRNASLVSLNDSIFCIGGSDEEKVTNSFCRFTPSSSEWVDLEPMKNARSYFNAVAAQQRIFVMGGWRVGGNLNEVESYDVTSKQWTSLSPMNGPYNAFKACHIDGWIYLVSWHENIWKVEKYDIANNRWCEVEFKDVKLRAIYEAVWIKF